MQKVAGSSLTEADILRGSAFKFQIGQSTLVNNCNQEESLVTDSPGSSVGRAAAYHAKGGGFESDRGRYFTWLGFQISNWSNFNRSERILSRAVIIIPSSSSCVTEIRWVSKFFFSEKLKNRK